MPYITQERLKQLLHYNPETGWFTNLVKRNYNAPIGVRAGKVFMRGRYRQIALDGLDYYEHHLVWLYMIGELPKDEIDHQDGNGTNNSWGNLRVASRSENKANSTSPISEDLRGAYYDSRRGHWYSKIQKDGQQIHLGRANSAEEAHSMYVKAAEHLHGEFAFHNRPDSSNHPRGVEQQSSEER